MHLILQRVAHKQTNKQNFFVSMSIIKLLHNDMQSLHKNPSILFEIESNFLVLLKTEYLIGFFSLSLSRLKMYSSTILSWNFGSRHCKTEVSVFDVCIHCFCIFFFSPSFFKQLPNKYRKNAWLAIIMSINSRKLVYTAFFFHSLLTSFSFALPFFCPLLLALSHLYLFVIGDELRTGQCIYQYILFVIHVHIMWLLICQNSVNSSYRRHTHVNCEQRKRKKKPSATTKLKEEEEKKKKCNGLTEWSWKRKVFIL